MAGKRAKRLPRATYEKELLLLQNELVKLQEWVRAEGAGLVAVFQGRDAGDKGGTVKRISEHLDPAPTSFRCSPRDPHTYVPDHAAGP